MRWATTPRPQRGQPPPALGIEARQAREDRARETQDCRTCITVVRPPGHAAQCAGAGIELLPAHSALERHGFGTEPSLGLCVGWGEDDVKARACPRRVAEIATVRGECSGGLGFEVFDQGLLDTEDCVMR